MGSISLPPMSRSPSLGVTLCNYNHGEFVGQAIEAIVSQSRPPDQLVIVDDGSTDNSADIIEAFARRVPCIRFVRFPKNRGLFTALQRALSEMQADYYYAAAADDCILPGFFEAALSRAVQFPQAGILVGRCEVVNRLGQVTHRPPLPTGDFEGYLSPEEYRVRVCALEPLGLGMSGAMVRKDAFDEAGGLRKELGHWCDSFLGLVVALRHGACLVPRTFCRWRKMPGSITGQASGDTQTALDIIARAGWLMRSPEFKDLFSEDWVARWETDAKERILRYRLSEFRRIHNARFDPTVARLYGRGGVAAKVSYILDRALQWHIRAGAARIERQFRNHGPDLSCYSVK